MRCDLNNNMIAHVENSTLYAIIKSPSDHPAIAESVFLDLAKNELWCNSWDMSTSIVVSYSRTTNPLHPNLIINGHSLAMDD